MAKELSNYQQKLVERYYKNLDTIMLNKLAEIVSDLYLADTSAKRDRLWKRAEKAMLNLKIQPALVRHIMTKKDVQVLAKNLNDWLAISKKR